MRKSLFLLMAFVAFLGMSADASAQYKKGTQEQEKTEAQLILEEVEAAEVPVAITLDEAIKIALSENVSVKVADLEIKRTEYAKKGTYASLFPKIDGSGSFQRTIKKQVMYMDIDMSSMMGGAAGGSTGSGSTGDSTSGSSSSSSSSKSSSGGLEVGRYNTWSAGVSASMPIVNAQLWKSLQISDISVELAVEKARSSKLETITQVKQAYFGTLLAKEAFNVYKEVYENAVKNFENIEKKYKVQKASEMELLRAKTTVANAVPNVYNAESSVILALWQLKAVLGVDLDMNLDVAGCLNDYSAQMFRDIHEHDAAGLDGNSTMKQLALQAEQLAQMVKMQQFANIPSLAVAFNYSYNAMANDFKFNDYRWTPYSFVALQLSIPIFAGGKRHNDIRQARNQHAQMQYQIENTERQLKIAIRNSLTTMETNMKTYYSAEEAVALAQKSYDVVSKSYEVGRATILDLNDAQLALTQARLGQSQAIYNFVIAKAQLEQTLGADFVNE
jgi:outer membrane protein TolC